MCAASDLVWCEFRKITAIRSCNAFYKFERVCSETFSSVEDVSSCKELQCHSHKRKLACVCWWKSTSFQAFTLILNRWEFWLNVDIIKLKFVSIHKELSVEVKALLIFFNFLKRSSMLVRRCRCLQMR